MPALRQPGFVLASRPMKGRIAIALLGSVVGCSGGRSPSSPDAGSRPRIVTPSATPVRTGQLQRLAVERGMTPVSLDADGVPRLMRASRPLPPKIATATPELAARAFVAELAPVWGLGVTRAADLETQYVNPMRNGASIVALRQRIDGVEVYHSAMRALLKPDKSLHAISGTPVRADRAPRPTAFRIGPAEALVAALADRWGVTVAAAQVKARAAHAD